MLLEDLPWGAHSPTNRVNAKWHDRTHHHPFDSFIRWSGKPSNYLGLESHKSLIEHSFGLCIASACVSSQVWSLQEDLLCDQRHLVPSWLLSCLIDDTWHLYHPSVNLFWCFSRKYRMAFTQFEIMYPCFASRRFDMFCPRFYPPVVSTNSVGLLSTTIIAEPCHFFHWNTFEELKAHDSESCPASNKSRIIASWLMIVV